MAGDFTLGGINFAFNDPGDGAQLKLSSNKENARLDVTYRVKNDYSSRQFALMLLRGYPTYQPTSSINGYIVRAVPHRIIAESNWLYCTQAGYRGHIADVATGTVPNHKDLLIDAVYEGLPYNIRFDSDMTRTSDTIAWGTDESWWELGDFKRFVSHAPPKDKHQIQHFKGSVYKWKISGVAAVSTIGIPRHETEHVLTWHEVPYANIPWAHIAAIQGTMPVEDFAFFKAEKAAFDSYSLKNARDVNGQKIVDISYTITEKPQGANFFPDPARGGRYFELTAFDGSGRQPFTAQNWRYLFRPEPAIA